MIKKKKDGTYDGSTNGQWKTFKIQLKSIVNSINGKYFMSKIDELIPQINDLIIHSYQFIKLYTLYCFHNNYSLEINTEFIRYCISILRESKSDSTNKFTNQDLLSKLNWVYENEYKPTINHVKPYLEYTGAFITNIVNQVETMISNNCQQRFIVHFLRFVNETTKQFPKKVFKFKKQILSCDYLSINPIFYSWIQAHFMNIFPFSIEKSVYYDIKVKPLSYLRSMIYMTNILENMEIKIFKQFH